MHRPRIGCLSLFVAAGLVAAFGQPAEAQRGRRKGGLQARQSVPKEIATLLKELRPAQEELASAQRAAAEALSRLKQARGELSAARKSVHERAGTKVGLPGALKQLDAAREEHENACAELVRGLQDDEEFQHLKRRLADAEQRLQTLKTSKSTSGGSWAERYSAASQEVRRAREAYQSRLDKDPAVRPSFDRRTKLEARVKELRKAFLQAVKDDAEVNLAAAGFQQAKAALEAASQAEASAAQKVAALQSRLAAVQARAGR